MVESAEVIWADGPSSAPSNPPKAKIRAWGKYVETALQGAAAGATIYDSKADMDADTSQAANAMAWVLGDATAANNGVYQFDGTSTWTRLGDLPYSHIKASNAGVGTANAIAATTSIPIPAADGAALIALPIVTDNTASPVTVAFNGATALTIKTNAGNDIAVGGLKTSMIVAGYVSGSTFRLLSDQASAAIQAACEAAQAAAEAAAASIDNLVVADRTALKTVNTAAHTVVYLKEAGREGNFKWDSSDLSAEVTADPNENTYVAPSSDPTGDSGAWVRKLGAYVPLHQPARIRSVQERLSEGVFLDDFLGATDTDKALDFAENSDVTFLKIPARVVDIESTISGTNKYWCIKGESIVSSTIKYHGTADDQTPVFSFIRTNADIKSVYEVSNLRFDVDNAFSGIPIRIEEQRPNDGNPVIVGGIDFLHLDNVNFDASGSGYWARLVHAVNAGGINVRRINARNSGSLTAQSDTRTKGFYIINSQSNLFMVRTLFMSQFALSRMYNGIEVSVVNSVESLYLDQFEIAACRDAILVTGAGKMGATGIGHGHMGITHSGIFANNTAGMNIVRLNGTDIRKGDIGGVSSEAGNCVHLASGALLFAASGCFFQGDRDVKPTSDQSGILIAGVGQASISGNVYRNFQYGNNVINNAADVQIGPNTYVNVEKDNNVVSTNSESVNIISRYQGKRALAYRTTDFNIANNTNTNVPWQSVNDDLGFFNLPADNTLITITDHVSRVKLRAQVQVAAAATGDLTLQIVKNGAAVLGGGYRVISLADTTDDVINVETAGISCAKDDTFTLQIKQTSGSPLAFKGTGDAGLRSWFEIEVLS